MKKLALLLLLPMFLAATCEDDDQQNTQTPCTGEARAGLNASVKDAITHMPLFDGVEIVAVEGQYNETLQAISGSQTFAGAWERTGYYQLTVSKEGYQTLTSDLIVVSGDACHVVPRLLEFSLQPE